jgi:hypothetical protein
MRNKTILKLKDSDEEEEIQFELEYLSSLTIQERFQLMMNRNQELINILGKNGHRRSPQIIKRA